ncbi:MarR family winged helix-turn-helix transcriptional regulator [Luethyella okanaganae]|uniref:MarR family winged helix-turn-helix transcriptional regulator n=1 Tax=Luethyella okanaganae TaxID=69372 RepID=A0ABW1VIU5_9MICO
MDLRDLPSFTLRRATHLLDRVADRLLQREFGLSYSLFLVLLALADGGRAKQTDIADSLDVSRASITARVRELGRRGLVAVCQSAEDPRANTVALSPEGERLLGAAWAALENEPDGLEAGVDIDGLAAQLDILIAKAQRHLEHREARRAAH